MNKIAISILIVISAACFSHAIIMEPVDLYNSSMRAYLGGNYIRSTCCFAIYLRKYPEGYLKGQSYYYLSESYRRLGFAAHADSCLNLFLAPDPHFPNQWYRDDKTERGLEFYYLAKGDSAKAFHNFMTEPNDISKLALDSLFVCYLRGKKPPLSSVVNIMVLNEESHSEKTFNSWKSRYNSKIKEALNSLHISDASLNMVKFILASKEDHIADSTINPAYNSTLDFSRVVFSAGVYFFGLMDYDQTKLCLDFARRALLWLYPMTTTAEMDAFHHDLVLFLKKSDFIRYQEDPGSKHLRQFLNSNEEKYKKVLKPHFTNPEVQKLYDDIETVSGMMK